MAWRRISSKTRRDKALPPFLRLEANLLVWGKATDRLLGIPTHVNLMIDENAKRIGVCSVYADDPDAFPVDRSTTSARIRVRTVLERAGLQCVRVNSRPAFQDGDIVGIDAPEVFGGAKEPSP